ncbi:MAG: hypothetical protein IJX72_05250 [Clostridia bacterium]|nr:hypothetical protein [Clostridia bacterium]
MGNGFLKFKRKLWTGAVIRALLSGVSLGLVAVAVQWLIDKLTLQQPDFLRYGLWGGIFALLVFAGVLLLLLPTNKRVAQKLDSTLALGEKVQTMLAFRDDTGAMAALQRADTDRILNETPKKRIKGACTWVFVLIPLLACFCMVGTVLVPAKEPPAPPPAVDNNFSITPWQEQALMDLIEKVKTSEMEETPKEGVVKQLESLLIKLKSIKKESVMKETVIATIEAIHEVVSEHNTYDLIASAMFNSPSSSVQDLGGAVDSLKSLLVGEWMNTVGESVKTDPATAATLANGIRQALTISKVDTANEVYAALNQMADALGAVTIETPSEEVDALVTGAEGALNGALYVQATNEEVEDDTIYTLLSIFGIKASEVPEHVFNDPEDPRAEGDYEPEDDVDKIHSGGLGPGNMIYGSDDVVYDPDKNAYVTYGEVINSYFAKITEMMVDGSLPPELEEMLSDYFAFLFNGTENKESNGNS